MMGYSGGGGFVPDSSFNSPAKQGRYNSSNGNAPAQNTVRHVTIKQILEASQTKADTFSVDNVEIAQVVIAGTVDSFRTAAAASECRLNDETGYLQVRGVPANFPADLQDGCMVKVTGVVRTFQSGRYLSPSKIVIVTDEAEMKLHFLMAINHYLYFTVGAGAADGPTAAPGSQELLQQVIMATGNPKNLITGTSTPSTSGGADQNRHDSAPSNSFHKAASAVAPAAPVAPIPQQYNLVGEASSMTPVQRAVFQMYKTSTAEEGLKIDDVILHFRSRYNELEVRKSVQYLLGECFLYTTLDDAHARYVGDN